ncbi:MAG: hypothetical protein NDF55_01285 [archaeon GB-1867-005]|nr:hypothetical protein [Candidatus Culexmicrobium cathedralense]
MKRRKGYPKDSDIRSAIYKAYKEGLVWRPEKLCETVIQILENQELDIRYITEKRIWRNYERMVRKGWMRDWLGVVIGEKSKRRELK